MKRVKIKFSVDNNYEAHIIETKDDTMNLLCKSVGTSFRDLGIDLDEYPNKKGLYRGVIEIRGNKEQNDIYLSLSSYKKIDIQNKQLIKFVGALLKQQGGQLFIKEVNMQQLNKKFRVNMYKDKKEDCYVLELEEG